MYGIKNNVVKSKLLSTDCTNKSESMEPAHRRGGCARAGPGCAAAAAPGGAGDSQLMSSKGVGRGVSAVGERGGRGAY